MQEQSIDLLREEARRLLSLELGLLHHVQEAMCDEGCSSGRSARLFSGKKRRANGWRKTLAEQVRCCRAKGLAGSRTRRIV